MDLAPIAHLHPSFDDEHGLLVLDLHHGKANEMGTAELDAFDALCELIEQASEIRCLVTTSRRRSSKGKPIFIAGANVKERVGWDDAKVKAHVRRQRDLMVRLRHLPIFTIALASGVTLGWGVEFLLTADYVLATAEASFGLPETGLGILPGARGTAELAHLVGPNQALRLGCTAERIGLDEALRIGLVQEATADVEAGLERSRKLAGAVARNSPTAVAAFKQAVLAGLGRPESVRLELEARAYEHCVDHGEAAIGRSHFEATLRGGTPPWGPRRVPAAPSDT
ncbi:MAG: hypothetical protein D6705_10595 [Deltaproteobacteria bacterium]|nr:MAG: hypothetical protein D6705_10595 [Deltaproteobacteria bacterium]